MYEVYDGEMDVRVNGGEMDIWSVLKKELHRSVDLYSKVKYKYLIPRK